MERPQAASLLNREFARMIRRVAIVLALLLTAALGRHPAFAEDGARVYAAASLAESIAQAADAWAAAKHPRPTLILASSSELARQIEAGAPGGVFISADETWMRHVNARGRMVPGTRARLLTNRLVLATPLADTRQVKLVKGFDLAAFVGDKRWATGDPDAVPAGRYAKSALTSLGSWKAAEPRLVGGADVRAALALVEQGQVGAGIVYRTDALASKKVSVAGVFPENSHPPIVYPIALTQGAGPEARSFANFLRGGQATAIFRAHGFGIAH